MRRFVNESQTKETRKIKYKLVKIFFGAKMGRNARDWQNYNIKRLIINGV